MNKEIIEINFEKTSMIKQDKNKINTYLTDDFLIKKKMWFITIFRCLLMNLAIVRALNFVQGDTDSTYLRTVVVLTSFTINCSTFTNKTRQMKEVHFSLILHCRAMI